MSEDNVSAAAGTLERHRHNITCLLHMLTPQLPRRRHALEANTAEGEKVRVQQCTHTLQVPVCAFKNNSVHVQM